jgi:hypothetical protein
MNSSTFQRSIGFRPWEIPALVNEDVISQYAEGAAFLWIMRDSAVNAPNYSVQEFAALDERVEAQLQRAASALELPFREPTHLLFEVRIPGKHKGWRN